MVQCVYIENGRRCPILLLRSRIAILYESYQLLIDTTLINITSVEFRWPRAFVK